MTDSEAGERPARRRRTTPRWAIASGLFTFVVLGAGLAVAVVPNGNTFNACRNKTTFAIRVIDKSAAQACTANETAMSWRTWKWRGAWQTTTAYVIGDAVRFGGQSYTAVANSTNKPPATNPGSWSLLAAKGAPGVAAGLGTATNQATVGMTSGSCVLGQILLFAGDLYSKDTVPASGQTLNINTNQALFSLLGTTYGGNGVTTFALPNLQSLAPDHMTYTICIFGTFP